MAWNPDWHLERYGKLLKMLVRGMGLDPRLRRRFDSSDLVQETLLKAHASKHQFQGDQAQLVQWLKKILDRVVIDKVREAGAGKRNVALDRSIHAVVVESSGRLGDFLEADQSSPSQRAERHEELLRQAAALDQLAEDEHDVIIHHYWLKTPIAQIAEQMGRTEKAVANLLYRTIRKLKKILDNASGAPHAPGDHAS